MSEKETVTSIFKTARGFWEARILMTAAELDKALPVVAAAKKD